MRINEEMKDWTSGRNQNLCNKFNGIFGRGVAQLGSALGSGNSGLWFGSVFKTNPFNRLGNN